MREIPLRSILVLLMCLAPMPGTVHAAEAAAKGSPMNDPKAPRLATFGGGCFWCTEAVFLQLKGVQKVESGYSGGALPDPSYEAVCTGTTGHAEVIQITYDPAVVTFAQLLEVFFKTHDPTTLNYQGADRGTQYRSVVFHHEEEQRLTAEKVKTALNESGAFSSKIVTEVTPFKAFYKADEYHQNYYNRNPSQGYCAAIITPKLDKFKKAFADLLKK